MTTTSTLVPFSLVILISTASLAPAQTEATPRPSAQPGGSPAVAAATSGPGTTTVANADYRIVPGDKLRIDVYKDAQLSQALQVRPDGKITLPLIGDVIAEGRTSTELRDSLVTSLKEYNTNPVVTVIVVETVPPMFYVMGEVNAPGSLPLKGQITVVQALAMAGGFKDFAKTNKIVIQRKGAAGTSMLKFNYNDAVNGKGPIMYLKPGDTIIVP
jgi:polysaccharide export outer membrane protein